MSMNSRLKAISASSSSMLSLSKKSSLKKDANNNNATHDGSKTTAMPVEAFCKPFPFVGVSWGKLATCGQQPSARWGHASALVGSKIYVLGGTGANHWADLYSFSTVDCTWTQLLPLASKQSHPKAPAHSLPGNPSPLVTIKVVPDFVPPAYYGAKMVAAHNHLWIFGGRGSARTKPRETFSYDMSSRLWTVISQPKPPSSRSGHSLSLELDAAGDPARLVLFGGNAERKYHNDLWFFSFETLLWTPAPTSPRAPLARSGHSAILKGTNLYIFGGFTASSPNYLDDLWICDLQTCSWRQLSLPPVVVARCGHQAALVRDTMIVFGGCNGREFLNDLHFFDLGSLTWLPCRLPDSSSSPSKRFHHSLVAIDDACYVFGGSGSGTLYADSFVLRLTASPSSLTQPSTDPVSNTAAPSATPTKPLQNVFELYASSVFSLQHSESERKALSLQVDHLTTQLASQSTRIAALQVELADARSQLLIAESSIPKSSRRTLPACSSKTPPCPAASPSSSPSPSPSDSFNQLQLLSTVSVSDLGSCSSGQLADMELRASQLLTTIKEARTFSLSREIDSLKSVNARMKGHLCAVCVGVLPLVVLLPCKHQAICKQCASSLDTCPICRQAISDLIEPC